MINYLVNAALILGTCLCFYKIFLRKETFHHLNRIVLFGGLLIAFALPLIPVPQAYSLRPVIAEGVKPAEDATNSLRPEPLYSQEDKSNVSESRSAQSPGLQNTTAPAQLNDPGRVTGAQPAKPVADRWQLNTANLWKWAGYIYWFGVAAFSLSLLIQLVLLLKRAYTLPSIIDGQYRIVEVSGNEPPSSFLHIIFINPAKYEWETYNQILEHEKIHIRQKHSIDILIAEIVIIFQWFNPFAWLYRKEVESNLEFLTDQQMLHNEAIEKQSYQLSILQVSAPRMPLSLTTNYNQSLVKKRIVMMNSKKSNINTAWKYIFMFPLLAVLASLLNEPLAKAQTARQALSETKKPRQYNGPENEGSWFATVKGDKVTIQFQSDDEENRSTNMNTFAVSEFDKAPANGVTALNLKREAGTMALTGKFEDGKGMGHYQFTPSGDFRKSMEKEGIDNIEDRDMIAFFFINLKQSYVQMLKKRGFSDLSKNDVIPMAALKIDEAYISSWQDHGYPAITIHELIPLHSLKIDQNYASEIKAAGYKDISVNQLITFKSQGIDGKYVKKIREASAGKNNELSKPTADELITVKALNVDPEYIKSMRDLGYEDLPHHMLSAMKSQNITPQFVKSYDGLGLGRLDAGELLALKSLNITPEFIKSYRDLGYNELDAAQFFSIKSMGITPEYIKKIEGTGLKITSINDLIALKSQGVGVDQIKAYQALGFKDLQLNDIMTAVSTGVTPEFVSSMKSKGHDLKTLQKYINLRFALKD
jgi:hypothetical protein